MGWFRWVFYVFFSVMIFDEFCIRVDTFKMGLYNECCKKNMIFSVQGLLLNNLPAGLVMRFFFPFQFFNNLFFMKDELLLN